MNISGARREGPIQEELRIDRRTSLPGPKFLLGDIETMSREDLERLQEARLARMLEISFERSPLLRQVWNATGLRPTDIKSISDFTSKAPFTSKDLVRQFRDAHSDPYGGLLCAAGGELTGVGFTSGTTGDPTPISRFTEGKYIRDYWHIGARPGDYHTNMLFTFRSGLAKRFLTDLRITPILFTHAPREVPRIVEASLRFRPTTMGIISSPLLNAFHDYFDASGKDPRDAFSSYRGGIFGGEPLAPRYQELTREWGIELFETTSIGDMTNATECWVHDGMHCYEDQSLIECLQPNGSEPVADGEIGELVVTALDDPILPVFRYRTDDLITLNRQRCICGRVHARVKVIGRKSDLVTIAGRPVLPRDIFPLIEGMKGMEHNLFQIVSSGAERDVLLLRVGYEVADGDAGATRLRDNLQDHLSCQLGISVEIEVVPKEDLLKLGPPHKIPRIAKH